MSASTIQKSHRGAGGRSKGKRGGASNNVTGEEQDNNKEEVINTYKNKLMAHDIHRVRELSALLEERRRFFDGQLGEVYRSAGVSSPSGSLPRLRTLDSPPASESVSQSNVTDVSVIGSDVTTIGTSHMANTDQNNSMDLQSCSGRSYSIFADDECSVAESFEFSAETKACLGRNWSSSTLLGAAQSAQVQAMGGKNKGKFVSLSKDSIQNEVMRAAELEKKLKARRASLPLALESSLKRPLKKKVLTKTLSKSGAAKEKSGREDKVNQSLENALRNLTRAANYSSTSSEEEPDTPRPRFRSNNVGADGENEHFSMTEVLHATRKYDLENDLKRALDLPALGSGSSSRNRRGKLKSLDSWDSGDLVAGTAARLRTKFSPGRRSFESNKSSLAPYADYSPRSSLSTLSGTYPRIAFSSLEKVYREEGDKQISSSAKYQLLHPSHQLLKPVPKIDMNLFGEPTLSETDYCHDFRYLSLLDALVPCFQPTSSWKKAKEKSSSKDQQQSLGQGSPNPYRVNVDSGFTRLFSSAL